jgi:predicted DNA-binding protein with PD1-like motif
MKVKKYGNKYFVRIDKDEEIMSSLKKFSEDCHVSLASVSGIGATDYVKMGLYNKKTKLYDDIELNNSYEITNITGNITTFEGEPNMHLHITLADENYKVFGGHLYECVICATCELVIDVIPDESVSRTLQEYSGLNIWDI